jgi:hypothetical protein
MSTARSLKVSTEATSLRLKTAAADDVVVMLFLL